MSAPQQERSDDRLLDWLDAPSPSAPINPQVDIRFDPHEPYSCKWCGGPTVEDLNGSGWFCKDCD